MPEYSSAEVKRYYEEWTERYIESFGEVFQGRSALNLDELMDYYIKSAGFKPGMKLVDAGCGICGPAIMLAKKLDVQIDAVTISDEQVKIAREKVKTAGLEDRIKVYQGDFHTMDQLLPNNHYDAVYFLEAFVHSPDTDKAVQAAVNVLKPFGFVYIKDMFHGTARSEEERQLIEQVVKNSCDAYRLNVKKLYEVVRSFEKTAVLFNFIKQLDIEAEWETGNNFVRRNELPIYKGTDKTFYDLKYLDFYEIKATKLA